MSTTTTDCLSYIIGLSQTTCNCFDSGKPSDYNRSDSGVYLDQLEGLRLNAINSTTDCEAGGLWSILERARDNARLNFKSDLMTALVERKLKQKREPFTGVIGSSEYKNTLTLSNNYGGIRIYCSNIISGVMTIERIGLVFGSAGTFDVSVYNGYSTTPINTYTVTSTTNSLAWYALPTPLQLVMNDDYSANPNYYILYEPSTSPSPKDIKASCGCNSNMYNYYWNTKAPMFKSYEKYRWSEYIMLTGTVGDTLADRADWATNGYLNGIMLDASFRCNTSELICKQNLNYESNPLALAMAYAIRFKAGALVIDELLSSSQINRYTMMDRESLSGKRNNYISEYNARVQWLAKEMNWKANDCLTCDTFNDVLKIGIFS